MVEPSARVLIVGDGPSAHALKRSSIVIPPSIFVIGVNAAGHWLDRADAFFTLDPSPRNRWVMRHQKLGRRYFAAVPSNYGHCRAHPGPVERNVTFLERIPGTGPQSSRLGMCQRWPRISSGNSAWGALNLAHHLQARRIGLIGVDGTREMRVSGGRPRALDHLPWLFSTYDGPADVRNGSAQSTITAFLKCSPSELIEWLSRPFSSSLQGHHSTGPTS